PRASPAPTGAPCGEAPGVAEPCAEAPEVNVAAAAYPAAPASSARRLTARMRRDFVGKWMMPVISAPLPLRGDHRKRHCWRIGFGPVDAIQRPDRKDGSGHAPTGTYPAAAS